MKKIFESLSWLVTYYDFNADKIKYYDIFKYREKWIKKLKKKCATKDEFSDVMRREFMWAYWSKCEWELVIEVDKNGRVWLNPWVGSREPDKARIDVTDRDDFDWKGFAMLHIGKQINSNKAKIDVFDQLTFASQFEKLVDYCWTTRLKYERKNPKFDN